MAQFGVPSRFTLLGPSLLALCKGHPYQRSWGGTYLGVRAARRSSQEVRRQSRRGDGPESGCTAQLTAGRPTPHPPRSIPQVGSSRGEGGSPGPGGRAWGASSCGLTWRHGPRKCPVSGSVESTPRAQGSREQTVCRKEDTQPAAHTTPG